MNSVAIVDFGKITSSWFGSEFNCRLSKRVDIYMYLAIPDIQAKIFSYVHFNGESVYFLKPEFEKNE